MKASKAQEEDCIRGVPCVTLRDSTESPETLEVGSNVLAGTDSSKTAKRMGFMIGKNNNWQTHFRDGKAGMRIIQMLREKFA
jgi:UDP-N-acetylglucosamine 2-epimerase (non-hydrolysing)